jgi:hypothetical protein
VVPPESVQRVIGVVPSHSVQLLIGVVPPDGMHCPIAVVPSVNICTASLLFISSISMQRLIAVVCRFRMQQLLAESLSVFVIWLKHKFSSFSGK